MIVEHMGLTFHVGDELVSVELPDPPGFRLAVATRKTWDDVIVPTHARGLMHTAITYKLEYAGFGGLALRLRQASAASWRAGA